MTTPPLMSAVKPALKSSSTLALNTRVKALLAEGQTVYHLGFGESRFPAHPKLLAALREHAALRSYLPVAGLPELRQAVAGYYNRTFGLTATTAQVLIGNGSKSLLFAAIAGLEGDLLLPQPSWVSYDVQAHLTGKGVTWIPTRLEDGYSLTPDGLQNGIRLAREAGQTPRILILTTPNNPTGVIYPADWLADLVSVARAAGIVLISDEIYALTTYAGDHISPARYYPEGTLITGGLSKHLSLGGWRLGVAILPAGELGEALLNYMQAVAGAVWTMPAAPVQQAAVLAYQADPDIERYIQTCTAIHGLVTQHLYQVMQSLGVPCPAPSGGFYLYPDFAPWRTALARQHNVHTAEDLARLLLDEAQIATLPGSDFGDAPEQLRLRLASSYLYALTDAESQAVLDTYRPDLPADSFLHTACPRVIEVGERFRQFVDGLGES